MNKKDYLRFAGFAAIAAVALFSVVYFAGIIDAILFLISILNPIIIGCAMAFVFNIIVVKIEKIYWPKSKNKVVLKTRRPLAILGSILIVIAIIAMVMGLVIPALVNAVTLLINNMSTIYDWVYDFIQDNKKWMPTIAEQVQKININWSSVGTYIMDFLKGGVSTIFGSTFSIISGTFSVFLDTFMAFIFSIYILAAKEKLRDQLKRFLVTYMPRKYKRIEYIYSVGLKSFTAFVVGQFTEACIIGTLTCLGLLALRLPYPVVIGALIGFTALIPIAGAYIGAIVGALLILTVSPIQSLIFLIFLVILQQLEGNLIYPKVVGTSIGLPGIWVFIAVIIGAGVAGIPGMLIGVPLMSMAYEILGADIAKKSKAKQLTAGLEDNLNPEEEKE